MGGLTEHAKQELKIIGMLDNENEMNNLMTKNILDLVEMFSSQGHSGFSASYCLETVYKLLKWKNLTEIKIDDFTQVSDKVFQCKRNPALFLADDKKGYCNVDNPEIITPFQEKQ